VGSTNLRGGSAIFVNRADNNKARQGRKNENKVTLGLPAAFVATFQWLATGGGGTKK
jgi:hypothetical protein